MGPVRSSPRAEVLAFTVDGESEQWGNDERYNIKAVTMRRGSPQSSRMSLKPPGK